MKSPQLIRWSIGISLLLAISELRLQAGERVEAFKTFLASPPNIERLTYLKITARDMEKGIQADEDLKVSKDRVQYYQASWQPGCLFLKSSSNFSPFSLLREPGDEIHLRLDHTYGILDRSGSLEYWQDPSDKLDNRSRPAFVFHHGETEFWQLVNMGILHIPVGSIRWKGDDLKAEGFIPEADLYVHISGQLSATSDDRPDQLSLQYMTDTRTVNYLNKFNYQGTAENAVLPKLIRSYLVIDGRQIELIEWKILSFESMTSKLPQSRFDPDRVAATHLYPMQIFTNNEWHARNALGIWTPIRVLPVNQTTIKPKLERNASYYASIATITLTAFAIILWRNTQQKQTKESIQ